MPWPVASLLNSPLMTFTLDLTGSSGSKHLPSSSDAPSPLAHQFGRLTPLPMNMTANRLANWTAAAPSVEAASAPPPIRPASDSSHGKAIVTPTPRRKVRRAMPVRSVAPDSLWLMSSPLCDLIPPPLVQELRAGDNRLDQCIQPVIGVGDFFVDLADQLIGGRDGAAAQGVGQQLADKVLREILLAVLADVAAEAVESLA